MVWYSVIESFYLRKLVDVTVFHTREMDSDLDATAAAGVLRRQDHTSKIICKFDVYEIEICVNVEQGGR